MNKENILEIDGLCVEFDIEACRVRAVDDVGFQLKKGSTLGIAGESGCGKTITALSIIRLLPKPVSRIVRGRVVFHGQDLLTLSKNEMHRIRGRKISMIFQEPMTALNPVHSIGKQMTEIHELHFPGLSHKERGTASVKMLEKVGISDPETVMKKYPHQLSGGMRQRVMIAMSLSCKPDILIADEPTTALDVTVQAQILDLIRVLKQESGMSVILITHDLGVIAENCDDIVVMYAGKIIEKADVRDLFRHPCHPYTKGLLASIPSLAKKPKIMLPTIPGNVPSLMSMPGGCRFQDRCPLAADVCRNTEPKEQRMGKNHVVSCHMAGKQGL
ncbi:MAG: peptide ABC transporter ATP-binding protein [Desulfobacterales bacterium RIFOXYA12_FULL_46_15]|nr:MAG: peptide ABC transporter ATP-binding protein [Desulfobacterales bacterium RIFOXYA12_FULL_46_15]